MSENVQAPPVQPPIEAPAAQGGSVGWYCLAGGQQIGPISLAQVRDIVGTDPVAMVWRPGLDQWVLAQSLPELGGDGSIPPIPIIMTPWRPDPKVRNAKQNCIAMFVVFCAGSAYPPLLLAAGLFAAFYLPLRWKVIRSLPTTFRVLGLIGGFGLLGFLTLGIVVVALGWGLHSQVFGALRI